MLSYSRQGEIYYMNPLWHSFTMASNWNEALSADIERVREMGISLRLSDREIDQCILDSLGEDYIGGSKMDVSRNESAGNEGAKENNGSNKKKKKKTKSPVNVGYDNETKLKNSKGIDKPIKKNKYSLSRLIRWIWCFMKILLSVIVALAVVWNAISYHEPTLKIVEQNFQHYSYTCLRLVRLVTFPFLKMLDLKGDY